MAPAFSPLYRGLVAAGAETGRLADVLDRPNDEAVLQQVREKVAVLTREFPVYR